MRVFTGSEVFEAPGLLKLMNRAALLELTHCVLEESKVIRKVVFDLSLDSSVEERVVDNDGEAGSCVGDQSIDKLLQI